jgi:hypothetical protein
MLAQVQLEVYFGGGQVPAFPMRLNTILYYISSTGNATSFGRFNWQGSKTYLDVQILLAELFAGYAQTQHQNVIDYVTMASTGSGIDFGDLTVLQTHLPMEHLVASSTRGIFVEVVRELILLIYYNINIRKLQDFGDLSQARP